MDIEKENIRKKMLLKQLRERVREADQAVKRLSGVAREIAEKCPLENITHVGAAVQVDGTDYPACNNFISLKNSPKIKEKGSIRDHVSLHAEGAVLPNIIKGNRERLGYPEGSILYCLHEPDPRDISLALECGIKDIRYINKRNYDNSKEQDDNKRAIEMLSKTEGVSIKNISPNEIENQKIADKLSFSSPHQKNISIITNKEGDILCETEDEYMFGIKEEDLDEVKEGVSSEDRRKLTVASTRSALMYKIKETRLLEQELFFITVKSCLKCSALLHAAGAKNIVYDKPDTEGGYLSRTGVSEPLERLLSLKKIEAGIAEVNKSEFGIDCS
ncbi:MAG: hypothetical protein LBG48_04360 [Rickettsiales bacterium]|jgi:deoxycytidylate deaminase|nr:hypothetical protein [Rickettsiales bacterium]